MCAFVFVYTKSESAAMAFSPDRKVVINESALDKNFSPLKFQIKRKNAVG